MAGIGAPVTLAELLARNIALEWYEAVAIVQELCMVLQDYSSAGTHGDISNLRNIQILPTGNVWVVPGELTDNQVVAAIGRILHGLLPDNTPVPLRLVVSQSASVSPVIYESVPDFSKALAFFERPGRANIITAIHQRYEAEPALGDLTLQAGPPPVAERASTTPKPQVSPRLQAPPQPQAPAQAETSPQPHAPSSPEVSPADRYLAFVRRHRKVFIASAAAVAIITASAAIVRLVDSKTVAQGNIGKWASQAKTTVAGTLSSAVSAVKERIGLAEAPAETAGPPSEPPPTRPRSARRAQPADQAPDLPSAPPGVFDLQALLPPPVPVPDTPQEGESETAERRTANPGSEPAKEVYGSEDKDVVPPVTIYPQLPTSLPPGVRPQDLGVIQLIITEVGFVERVELQSPPRVHDFMLLSATKTWRFKPALRNGRPVKYRKLIWVVVS